MMKKINDIIGDAKTIGIAGHLRPDGDCMGSCMSLYNYLKKNRPDLDVRVFLEFVDKKFNIIENTDQIITTGYDGTKFDLFISLDTASLDRLGLNLPFYENAKEQPALIIMQVMTDMQIIIIFCQRQVQQVKYYMIC